MPAVDDAEPRWLNARQIARHLGVGQTTVLDKLVPAGLPHNRVGSRWLFDPVAVDRWMHAHEADAIQRTLQRLHDEWAAGGAQIDDQAAERIADALRPARRRRRRLERERVESQDAAS
jgi:excisionase family DNA binding protein